MTFGLQFETMGGSTGGFLVVKVKDRDELERFVREGDVVWVEAGVGTDSKASDDLLVDFGKVMYAYEWADDRADDAIPVTSAPVLIPVPDDNHG